MSRVMTCVTRIAESAACRGLELLESLGDLLRLPAGVRRGVFQIGLIMFDGGSTVLPAEGDFAQAIINAVLSGNEFLQGFIVPLRAVQLVALQTDNRPVHQRD